MALRPLPQRAERAETLEECPVGVCDGGSGWVLDEQDSARECECRQRRISRAAHARLGSGVPKRFRGVSVERKPICDLDPVILRHVRRFVEQIDANLDEGRGLWFHGDVGTGKTSLAMLIAQAADDAGRSVAVYSVPHLLAEIRSTYDRDSSGYSYLDLFDRLCTVDLLVLDDLGAEKTTEWVLEQLYSIVNERWQSSGSVLTNARPAARHGGRRAAAGDRRGQAAARERLAGGVPARRRRRWSARSPGWPSSTRSARRTRSSGCAASWARARSRA